MSMVFVVKTLLVIFMLCLKVLRVMLDIIFLIKLVFNVQTGSFCVVVVQFALHALRAILKAINYVLSARHTVGNARAQLNAKLAGPISKK
jgi:hypothetical protein